MTATSPQPWTVRRETHILSGAGSDLARHHAVYGRLELGSRDIVRTLVESGLLGRGGAGFQAGAKLAGTGARRPVVVVRETGRPARPTILRFRRYLLLRGRHPGAH